MKTLVCSALILFLSGSIFSQHQPPQDAREELELGVKDYKVAEYESATDHRQRAVMIDPDFTLAQLYLATAYAQQYIPGVDTDDNNAMAKKAIQAYEKVLQLQPDSVNSLKGIAFLNLQMKEFEAAKSRFRQALTIDDKDPELYYSIGVIDWSESYKNSSDFKAELGKRPSDSPARDSSCWQLRERNLAFVEDGISMLTKAMELRKNYGDAMAYMNLLYRQRADIQCANRAESQADIGKANEWSDLAMQARKNKVEEAAKQEAQCKESAPQEQCAK